MRGAIFARHVGVHWVIYGSSNSSCKTARSVSTSNVDASNVKNLFEMPQEMQRKYKT